MRVLSLLACFAFTSCAEIAHMVKEYNHDQVARTADKLHQEDRQQKELESLAAALAFDGIPEAHSQ